LGTPDRVLAYTKATRLEQGANTRAKIVAMSSQAVADELAYMADTIPSSWEFVDYTFEILNVTLAFTHQFVRTRTGSYAQQTMRLLEKKQFTYRVPPKLLAPDKAQSRKLYEAHMGATQAVYDSLIAGGVAVEDARGVLPTNIHTNIIAKFNLRTLAEMARSRTGGRTQDEYREVVGLMLKRVMELHPWAEAFLSPERGRRVAAVEKIIISGHIHGGITSEERATAMKNLDAMRKGEA
jgi:flavin-dependent thymidylate synthase